jgi:hypothetical protein
MVDREQDMSSKLVAEVVGGLAGGVVFGIMMQSMGMIPMIASLVGSQSSVVWWVLGPLLIMPAMMGMPLFMFNGMTLSSLVRHLIYGALLGLGYAWYSTRS